MYYLLILSGINRMIKSRRIRNEALEWTGLTPGSLSYLQK